MADILPPELENLWRRTGDAQLRDRLRAIQLRLQGVAPGEIAQEVGRSVRFVQKWLAAYRDGGLDAVRESRAPGVKSRLTEAQEAEFCAHVEALLRSGAADRIRGRDAVRILAEKFGENYSLPGAYELMNRLGLQRYAQEEGGAASSEPARHGHGQKSEAVLLRSLLEAVPDGVCAVDGAGNPTAWNHRFAESWRLAPRSLETGDAKAVFEAMLAQVEDPAWFAEHFQRVSRMADAPSCETVRLRDGRVFEFSSSPLDGSAGQVWRVSDVTARARLEAQLREKGVRRSGVSEAMDGLLRAFEVLDPADSGVLYETIAATLVETLGVARAGVWLLSDEDTRLSCHSLCDVSGACAQGVSWLASGCPHYFAALAKKREIAAYCVRTHPAMREMAAGYFNPLGVVSVFDAPIHSGGRVVGVIRLEHAGAAGRPFAGDEPVMAHLAAGLVTRHLAERELHATEAKAAWSWQAGAKAGEQAGPAGRTAKAPGRMNEK